LTTKTDIELLEEVQAKEEAEREKQARKEEEERKALKKAMSKECGKITTVEGVLFKNI
jgi:FKBP-type peptidyl-prolyl cis-trans isomerase